LIAGGGVSLKQSMALIGNLISSGAGSNELRDSAIAGGLSGLAGKIPGAGLLSGIGSSMKQEITGRAAQAVLPAWAQRSYGNGGRSIAAAGGGDEKGSGSKNSASPIAAAGQNMAKNAITGGASTVAGAASTLTSKKNENVNNNKPKGNGQGNNLVNNAITNKPSTPKAPEFNDLYD
jgi:hypothetical protein